MMAKVRRRLISAVIFAESKIKNFSNAASSVAAAFPSGN